MARPYAWTEGRTRAHIQVAIEAIVQISPSGRTLPYNHADPRSVVVRLCREPQSLAEIGARLALPIGVARVLVSDLVAAELLIVRNTLTEESSLAQRRDLLERVLDGLHTL
ncbi:MAG TPA: DUF742 domain-containing protein [Pseudonocardiaceae bacterium]|jgi:hypothetical protein|nr:DUF742 domain-containing protein [Pseudonocardiaceae bacterium]